MIEVSLEVLSKILSMKEDGYSRREIARSVGIGESTLRYWEKTGKLSIEKPVAGGTTVAPDQKRTDLHNIFGKKRYVLTSAQNNTFVHEAFLKSLLTYCDYNDAELIVGTFTYNKNGFQNSEKNDNELWFDPSIKDNIIDSSCSIFDGLVWCGELNILPTAITPLNGFQTYCKGSSGVVPHAKVQLESIATGKHSKTRMMYTTGAVTLPNYIQKTAGQKAEFHHVLGALVAEVDDEGDWFVRQLIADSDTGTFYDLTNKHTPDGVEENCRVEGINWGDIHSEKPDEKLYKASFDSPNCMLDDLRPKYQFANDTLDFPKRNHHNIKDQYHRYRMQVQHNGIDTVEGDLKVAGETLMRMQRDWCKTVVVESNHDLAFMKWLKESDPKFDNVWNALFYHKCQVKVLNSILTGDQRYSIFEDTLTEMFPEIKAKFLRLDDSFIICNAAGSGIECGNHGHIGNNGGRGSVQSFKILDRRQNIGHTHSAFIRDSVYCSGVKGSLDMGYNVGGSSWSHSDIVTYPNGKRAIITWSNYKYKA